MFSAFDMMAMDDIEREDNFDAMLNYIAQNYRRPFQTFNGDELCKQFKITFPLSNAEIEQLHKFLYRMPGCSISFKRNPR